MAVYKEAELPSELTSGVACSTRLVLQTPRTDVHTRYMSSIVRGTILYQ